MTALQIHPIVIFLAAVAFALMAYVGMRDGGFEWIKQQGAKARRRLRFMFFEHHTAVEHEHAHVETNVRPPGELSEKSRHSLSREH
jgi:hypothetical protein